MEGDQANGKAWVGVVMVGHEDSGIPGSAGHALPTGREATVDADADADADAERMALRPV